MRINRFSGLFRRGCSADRGNAARDEEELQIDAALKYTLDHGNLDGFGGGHNERLALMTTAIRRGLVAWDQLRERYVLSALGQRRVYAPRPTSMPPKSTGDKSRRGWVGRLMTPGIAVIACLGLVTMVSTGSPPIASYFVDPVPVFIEVSSARSPPAGDEARTQTPLELPLPARTEQSPGDAKPPVSHQTVSAQSDEPATLEACAQRAFKAGGAAVPNTVEVGSVVCARLVTAAHEGRDQPGTTTATPAATEDTNFDVKGTPRTMGEAALRLKRDAAEQDRKLQELESDLKRNIGDILVILQRAADELAPDAGYRTILARETEGIRISAQQAEVDLDHENRQKAPYLEQKLSQLETVSRDAEELRTRLVANVDLLEYFKDRMYLVGGVSGRIQEVMQGVQLYLDGIEVIATHTERLATELDNYEGGIAKTSSVPTTQTSSSKSAALRHDGSGGPVAQGIGPPGQPAR